MKFTDLKKITKGGLKWTTVLADVRSQEDYEMAVRGPGPLVSKAFEKAEFEIQIDPTLSGEAGKKRAEALLGKYSAAAKDRFSDHGEGAFKELSAQVSEKDSVVVSFRRIRGDGTFWAIYIPILIVPAGANFFFVLPPVRTCIASVFPVSGDPDLFLTLNGILTPPVSASRLGGTAVDTVSFTSPPPFFPSFVPFFRLNGFATGVTGFFMAGF